ncbi:MAG TPA: hypothetical protein VGX76_08755 [Pirellulales bacterium]|jgi:hypothetical protein|nr:hypothetical protein [Pirellulales bacterium]
MKSMEERERKKPDSPVRFTGMKGVDPRTEKECIDTFVHVLDFIAWIDVQLEDESLTPDQCKVYRWIRAQLHTLDEAQLGRNLLARFERDHLRAYDGDLARQLVRDAPGKRPEAWQHRGRRPASEG